MSHFTKLSSPPRVRPQPLARVAKSDRTRAAILDSAFEFIWSHPFREMTVKSLMSQTGTGRSTFYRYFSDLHEVMEAMLAGKSCHAETMLFWQRQLSQLLLKSLLWTQGQATRWPPLGYCVSVRVQSIPFPGQQIWKLTSET